ncbi:hypothetical protein AB0O47_40180 [Streptomyces noursei]|uniref:hypothetical protein n=1 Tax=Streptomyces noursei TaxID=1971 RepID=UPI00344B2B91
MLGSLAAFGGGVWLAVALVVEAARHGGCPAVTRRPSAGGMAEAAQGLGRVRQRRTVHEPGKSDEDGNGP